MLQNVVTRKGSSKALTFSAPHVLKSILCFTDQKYISRTNFCKELHLGEGAVRTLISHLKEYELVDSIRAGTFLTDKGSKFAKQFHAAIPSRCFLKKCSLTSGKYNYAILLKKNYVSNIGNGMQQRDFAILYGANESLTLVFRNNEFVFSIDDIVCFTDEPEIKNYLIKTLEPTEGDIIIITSSDDKFVAEISGINTVLCTLGTHVKH